MVGLKRELDQHETIRENQNAQIEYRTYNGNVKVAWIRTSPKVYSDQCGVNHYQHYISILSERQGANLKLSRLFFLHDPCNLPSTSSFTILLEHRKDHNNVMLDDFHNSELTLRKLSQLILEYLFTFHSLFNHAERCNCTKSLGKFSINKLSLGTFHYRDGEQRKSNRNFVLKETQYWNGFICI